MEETEGREATEDRVVEDENEWDRGERERHRRVIVGGTEEGEEHDGICMREDPIMNEGL